MLKVSYVEGLVHKGSRSCLEGSLTCTYTVGGAGGGGACCMFPSRGRRLDLQAPDSAEGGLKKTKHVTHRTSGIICISVVFSCIYSQSCSVVFLLP